MDFIVDDFNWNWFSIFSDRGANNLRGFFEGFVSQNGRNAISTLQLIFSKPASQVIGGISFLVTMSLHLSGIEWTRDVSDRQDRNTG